MPASLDTNSSGANVPTSTLTVPNPRKIVGFCYTPQDGNSLLSSIAATLRYLDVSNLEEYDYYLRGHERFMTWTPEGNEPRRICRRPFGLGHAAKAWASACS